MEKRDWTVLGPEDTQLSLLVFSHLMLGASCCLGRRRKGHGPHHHKKTEAQLIPGATAYGSAALLSLAGV